jgi:hypothetical protein
MTLRCCICLCEVTDAPGFMCNECQRRQNDERYIEDLVDQLFDDMEEDARDESLS